jgi:hypothetical protein
MVLLAGKASAALRAGCLIKFTPRRSFTNLYVSVLNILRIPDTTFGNAAWGTGPLPGVV